MAVETGWAVSVATLGSVSLLSILLPAVPATVPPLAPASAWTVDKATLKIGAAAPVNQLYDGTWGVFDGSTVAAPVLAAGEWGFFTTGVTTDIVYDTDEIDGPITGTPGNAMLIAIQLANGVVANVLHHLAATGQLT